MDLRGELDSLAAMIQLLRRQQAFKLRQFRGLYLQVRRIRGRKAQLGRGAVRAQMLERRAATQAKLRGFIYQIEKQKLANQLRQRNRRFGPR